MPTDRPLISSPIRAAVLCALAALAQPVWAQTDDTTPFYLGGSLGASHVSNIYRTASSPNSDSVVSTGLLGGIDTQFGRQHLTLDGSLQNNRYSTNSELNYRSHSLRAAVDWQTVENLSGALSAKSDRSMADFNVGNQVVQFFQKNIETNEEYRALARLGVATRYTLEGGWTQRRRDFTAEQYGRLVYRQNTSSAGIYAMPGGNVRLGLVGRHTKGDNPRYLTGDLGPTGDLLFVRNDYSRDDVDLTANWAVAGHSRLNARISRSRTRNSFELLSDFSGTTGALGWDWQPTAKLQFNLQFARDTGQETAVRATDLNRVYTSWQLGGTYAVTGKISLSAKASSNVSRRSDAGSTQTNSLDDTKTYNLGLRWAITRSFSLSCQYDHISRDNNVPAYIYSASSYGCTGQALVY